MRKSHIIISNFAQNRNIIIAMVTIYDGCSKHHTARKCRWGSQLFSKYQFFEIQMIIFDDNTWYVIIFYF